MRRAVVELMAPVATPVSTIKRLQPATMKVLALPNLWGKFDELDMQPIGNSPEQFASGIQADILHWAKISPRVSKEAGRVVKPIELSPSMPTATRWWSP